jgi:hypothetical protein
MKSIGLALAAVFAAALISAPLGASAAAAKTDPYSKEQIAAGMKDGPAAVQTAGLPCTIADAAYLGEGTAKNPDDPKGKDVKVKSYEVACQQGMGYILQNYEGIPPKIYDCVSLSESPSACRLPENGDTKKQLAGVVAASGRTCAIDNARALGATKTGERFFEVGCAGGLGFILKVAAPTSSTPPTAVDCAQQIGTQLECKFTTAAQIDAANTAAATALVAKSGKTCQLSKTRLIGELQSGDTAYEVACADGAGWILEAYSTGAFHAAINCANAGEACKLTDATKAQSAETGTYTTLAKAGGFPCNVSEYRYIGIDSAKNEVVELKCSNRPDGGLGFFPSDNGPGHVIDCVQAEAIQQSCKLSDPAAVYSKYTAALASKGRTTCKVSAARGMGKTADGNTFVETGCSDGLPGWVVSLTPGGQVSELLTCGQAKGVGVGCSLPGNVK